MQKSGCGSAVCKWITVYLQAPRTNLAETAAKKTTITPTNAVIQGNRKEIKICLREITVQK
jgi:hypothetical protein